MCSNNIIQFSICSVFNYQLSHLMFCSASPKWLNDYTHAWIATSWRRFQLRRRFWRRRPRVAAPATARLRLGRVRPAVTACGAPSGCSWTQTGAARRCCYFVATSWSLCWIRCVRIFINLFLPFNSRFHANCRGEMIELNRSQIGTSDRGIYCIYGRTPIILFQL